MLCQLSRCSLDQGGLEVPKSMESKKLFEPFSDESIFKALKRVILISHNLRDNIQEMFSRLEFCAVNFAKE